MLGADAGRAQRRPFLDVGARQQIRARVLERPRHLRRAVAVGVGLTTAIGRGGNGVGKGFSEFSASPKTPPDPISRYSTMCR
jgi:hypothetical protein